MSSLEIPLKWVKGRSQSLVDVVIALFLLVSLLWLATTLSI
ncbi:hypothetical protein [Nostoc sp. DedQUE09]|nr:hypothetical protein [Nostoc sp. DedQUE09]MDZ7950577.1 hypothetical protein [Nostoc sp. DedQUE09]